jgi:mono/diheme cytochrome c family protein
MMKMLKRSAWVGVFLITVSACQSTEELKTEQYYSEGYQLYTAHCANCHQADGRGLADLYPPLRESTYLSRKSELICVIKNGLSGEIKVAGKTYNRPMPANSKLTDIEIAEIVTYVTNTWGQETRYTPTDSVTAALTRCADERMR